MGFYKFLFSKQFLKQIAIAIGLIIVITIVVLQLLKLYTRHGESVEVPDLKEITLEDAGRILEGRNLNYQVIDSVYMKNKRTGIIIEQTPAAGEKVKENRSVYLVVSSDKAPMIVLPDVRDISLRNAKSMLESIGFQIIEIEYVPSEYKDLVKDVKIGEKILSPGTKLVKDTGIKLVVGLGELGEDQVNIPSFRAMSKEAAIQQAHANNLTIRMINYDVSPKTPEDEAKYFVYKQNPFTGTMVQGGSSVDIWLSKDKSLLQMPEKTADEDNQKPADIETFF